MLLVFFPSYLSSDLSNMQGSSFGFYLTNPETLVQEEFWVFSPVFLNLIFRGKAEIALFLNLAALK